MAFVQQTKEQTYKFTGSQRKCSFMLMISRFSIFLLIEGFIFGTVINYTASGFYYVIAQVTFPSFAHNVIMAYPRSLRHPKPRVISIIW